MSIILQDFCQKKCFTLAGNMKQNADKKSCNSTTKISPHDNMVSTTVKRNINSTPCKILKQNADKKSCKTKQCQDTSKSPYICSYCNFETTNKYNYNQHCSTKKHLRQVNGQSEQVSFFESTSTYKCIPCNYSTIHAGHYKQHCKTKRHIKQMKTHKEAEKSKTKSYLCDCGEVFHARTTWWRHKKICNGRSIEEDTDTETVASSVSDFHDSHISGIVGDLMKQNQTLMERNQELVDKIADIAMQPKVVNNQFNLMNYLNTECADAMDMSEFIDSIEVTNESLYLTCQRGFQHAFEKLFIDALEEVGEKRRPIHCTDRKRKKFVVKEDGVWQREEDGNPILDRAMHGLNDKQFLAMQQWKTYHPDWLDRDDYLDFTNNLTQELCLIYKEVKKRKIVKTIADNVYLTRPARKF